MGVRTPGGSSSTKSLSFSEESPSHRKKEVVRLPFCVMGVRTQGFVIDEVAELPFSSYMLGHITSYGKLTASGSNIWRVIGYASLIFIRDCCCHTLEKSFFTATD